MVARLPGFNSLYHAATSNATVFVMGAHISLWYSKTDLCHIAAISAIIM